MMSNLCIAVLYGLFVLRGTLPFLFGILVPNFMASLAVIFRLEGTKLFLGAPKFNGWSLFWPVATVCGLVYFSLVQVSMLLRTTLVSVFLAIPLFHVSWLLLTHSPPALRKLSIVCACIFTTFNVVMLLRAAVWWFVPEERELFRGSAIQLLAH